MINQAIGVNPGYTLGSHPNVVRTPGLLDLVLKFSNVHPARPEEREAAVVTPLRYISVEFDPDTRTFRLHNDRRPLTLHPSLIIRRE